MRRLAGKLALIGAGCLAVSGLTTIGSDGWVTASYQAGADRAPHVSGARALVGVVGDEAYWLSGPRAVTPVVAAPLATEAPAATRAFGLGTRMTLSGADRMSLDIVASAPVPLDSGLVDGHGRPLILVTAKERGKGQRIVRFLVEADAPAPMVPGKAL